MWKSSFSASAVVVLVLGMNSMAHAQYVRSCGKVSPLSSQGAMPTMDPTGRPYTGTEYLEFTPSLCVSERYDSNVLYAPPQQGLKRDDFVTNINPNLRVNHNGEYATGYLEAGAFGETYVRNPGLNYIGTSDTLNVSLDNSVKRLLPNASLSITDIVRYTPIPPGFSNPAAGTSPSNPANIQNVYAQGLLSYRTNNLMNNGSVFTSYAITPATSVNASYTHAIIRFGSSPVTSVANAALFDSTIQTGTAGARTQVSALDALTIKYSHTQSEFVPHTMSVSSRSSFFKTNTVTTGWSRTLTPYLTMEAGGGAILIDPGVTTYAANASLAMNLPNHIATISYARSAFPSFVGAGEPIVSNVYTLTASQKIARQWELAETANYAHSSGGGSGAAALKFNTYFGSVDLYYWITRIWSTALSFDYLKLDQTVGPVGTTFDRYAITFTVKATWN